MPDPTLTPEQARALSQLLAAHTNPDPSLLDLLPAPEPDPRLSWDSKADSDIEFYYDVHLKPSTSGNVVMVNIPNQGLYAKQLIRTATALLDAAAGLEGWSEEWGRGTDAHPEYRTAKGQLGRLHTRLAARP